MFFPGTGYQVQFSTLWFFYLWNCEYSKKGLKGADQSQTAMPRDGHTDGASIERPFLQTVAYSSASQDWDFPESRVEPEYFIVFDGLLYEEPKSQQSNYHLHFFKIFKLTSSERIPWSSNCFTTMGTFSIALTSPVSHSTLKASFSFTQISLENILSQQTNFTIYCITGCLFEQVPRLPSLKITHTYPST